MMCFLFLHFRGVFDEENEDVLSQRNYNFFYNWKLMKDQEVLFVEYVPYDTHNAEKNPVEDALHWAAP